MGLREEIYEELEEQERERTNFEEIHDDTDSDREFHGIGWNILYDKFIKNDF